MWGFSRYPMLELPNLLYLESRDESQWNQPGKLKFDKFEQISLKFELFTSIDHYQWHNIKSNLRNLLNLDFQVDLSMRFYEGSSGTIENSEMEN